MFTETNCMKCKSYIHLKTKKVELEYQNEFKLEEITLLTWREDNIDKLHIKVTMNKLIV